MFWKLTIIAVLAAVLQVMVILTILPAPWWVGLPLFFLNFLTLYFFESWNNQQELQEEERIFASIDPTVQIAHETLPYLRQGLNEMTAKKTAELIQKIAEVPAVAITDKEQVLAYLGAGCHRHFPGAPILTEATQQVIATGKSKIVQTSRQLNCPEYKNCDCPLAAAIIVPLKVREQVVGTLKLYQTKEGQLPPHVIRLAMGIAQLLGMQMELAELDRQAQLVTKAELDALQAQINPHFFFNTLNTIIMYSRTNPKKARRLLVRLADFFRRSMKRHKEHFIPLQEELEFVNTYLVLEKARFGPKLQIIQEIDPRLLGVKIPVLCVEPLVENAVKHGLSPKVGPGAVIINARQEGDEMVITVKDDGVGIPPEKQELVLQAGHGVVNGVGLNNVHERLKSLYGPAYGLQFTSQVNKGTTFTVRIPLKGTLLNNPQEDGKVSGY